MKKVIALLFTFTVFVFLTGCEQSLNKPSASVSPTAESDKVIQFMTPSPKPTAEPDITPTVESDITQTVVPSEYPQADEDLEEEDYSENSVSENEAQVINEPDEEYIPAMANLSTQATGSDGSPSTESGSLSNKKMGWYFSRNKEGEPPSAQKEFDISQYGGYYLGDTAKKVIYLTFDEGYENGYTEKILDVLKEKNVPAAFFVTQTYIRDNVELVKRMAAEGHLVCNHSVKHKSFPSLSDDEIASELKGCEDYYKETIGYEMPKFFRPPMGEYSARVLDIINKQGYKTIFWSFAHKDWEVDNQPSADTAYQRFMKDLHNGSIPLLHAVSSANTQALPRMIDSAREMGYEFVSLNELP